MRFVWVGIAGAVGSIVRYAIGLSVDQSRFPWATFGINVAGALLLGFFLAVAFGHLPMSVMTPIAVGLIGGFTTFSTFTWEAFTLGRTGRSEVALLYVTVSICCGLVGGLGRLHRRAGAPLAARAVVIRRRRRRRPCPSPGDRRARESPRRPGRAGTSRTRAGAACRRATR